MLEKSALQPLINDIINLFINVSYKAYYNHRVYIESCFQSNYTVNDYARNDVEIKKEQLENILINYHNINGANNLSSNIDKTADGVKTEVRHNQYKTNILRVIPSPTVC